MNEKKFKKIFKKHSNKCSDWKGDKVYKGLKIISKYCDNVILGADHEIIYSVNIKILIEGGITKKNIIKLALLNWMIQDDSHLACFV